MAVSSPISFCHAMTSQYHRGLVPTPLGRVHYQAVGDPANTQKLPMVGFHMSPRSSDEYKEVMLLEQTSGEGRMVIAMDQLGFGHSDNPKQSCSLDDMADAFVAVLDHMRVQKCIVTGSFTGNCLALSLASRYPNRVVGVVCSNLYHYTAEARGKALQEENRVLDQAQMESVIADNWNLQHDGGHIQRIWDKRLHLIQDDELNTRVTLDELQYLVKRRERYQHGVHIQDAGTFPLPNSCWNTICPVLCINGAEAVQWMDSKGMDMTQQFQEVMTYFINPPVQITLQGGGIYMLNENAEDWWNLVETFAGNLDRGGAQTSPYYDQQMKQQQQANNNGKRPL